MAAAQKKLSLVLLTGMAGSGKSVALHALEDLGFYCVDNLPPDLLLEFIALEQHHRAERVAVAVDVRSVDSLHLMPKHLDTLVEQNIDMRCLFLDASTETLVHRFSETRRKHPLSGNDPNQQLALITSIEKERAMLQELRDRSHVIDTGLMRTSQLQSNIKSLVNAPTAALTLVFESFAFKRGVPLDADFVFDVRMLPNPHYEPELKRLTGRDAPVAQFLTEQHEVGEMLRHICAFLTRWLPALSKDHRSYVTVAIGCTGGQHRSVYLVEQLTGAFSAHWATIKRHRELVDGH